MTSTHFHPQYGFPGLGLVITDDTYDTVTVAWHHVSRAMLENYLSDFEAYGGTAKRAYAEALKSALTATQPGKIFVPGIAIDDRGMSYGVLTCEEVHA